MFLLLVNGEIVPLEFSVLFCFSGPYIFSHFFSLPLTTQLPKGASNSPSSTFFLLQKLQSFIKIAYTFNYLTYFLSHLPWYFLVFLYLGWICLPDSGFRSNIGPIAYFLLHSLHFSQFAFACLKDWHWVGALEITCQNLAFSYLYF